MALIVISLKQTARSRRFMAGAVVFYALLFGLSLCVAERGPAGTRVKFFVSTAWFFLFA